MDFYKGLGGRVRGGSNLWGDVKVDRFGWWINIGLAWLIGLKMLQHDPANEDQDVKNTDMTNKQPFLKSSVWDLSPIWSCMFFHGEHFGASWGALGRPGLDHLPFFPVGRRQTMSEPFGHLEAILDPSWSNAELILGSSWCMWELLEPSWSHFGIHKLQKGVGGMCRKHFVCVDIHIYKYIYIYIDVRKYMSIILKPETQQRAH